MYLNKLTIFIIMILLLFFSVSCSINSENEEPNEKIVDTSCSIEIPKGICESDKDICFNGVCTLKKELCSKENMIGICESGMTCCNGSCEEASSSCRDITPEISGYDIFFSDEFNDDFNGAPNPMYWDYDIDYIRNNEDQCYTDNRRENTRVESRTSEGFSNGYLVLEARKEEYRCPQSNNDTFQYTSGSITTRKRGWKEYLVDMPHGKYQIRAKIPSGKGTWPAIWMVGGGPLGSWPNSGEIDIMEAVGFQEAAGKYVLHSAIHRNSKFGWPNTWDGTGIGMTHTLEEPPSKNFHLWELEWTPNSLEFFIDGERVTQMFINQPGNLYETIEGFFREDFNGSLDDPLAWPYSRESGTKFKFILNLAMGGSWGGEIDDSIFDNGNKVEMLVDYIRVYTKK